jgi:Spy/CpxP family protein refolding chaperone
MRRVRGSRSSLTSPIQGCLAGALCLALGLAGTSCASSTALVAPPVASEESLAAATLTVDDDVVSEELQAEHRHQHAGFAGFVMMAVETLGITPDQQAAIDAIRAELRARAQPVRDANDAVIHALADGIASGNIDAAKVDAAVARVTEASGPARGATADALNQLHGVLRPEQRVALVDKIEAQWTVWKEANVVDAQTVGARPDGRVAHLTAEIGLSSDQIEKLRGNLAAATRAPSGPFDPTEAQAHMTAFAGAFPGAVFDAKALSTGTPESTGLTTWGAARMAHFYEALAPVLTVDQRAKVADKVRRHATKA